MVTIRVEASAEIDAPPERVYAIFADYRREHPQILPPEHFSQLKIEEGGTGAGTVFRVRARALGVESAYHMLVSEPDPGRTLVETDMDKPFVTSFTIDRSGSGRQSRITIASEWAAKPGAAGVVERLINPPVLRRIFHKELRRLAAHVRGNQGSEMTPDDDTRQR